MKKKTKVILAGGVVFLAIIGAGAIWQRQNIKAVMDAAKYSKEELALQINEQKASVESVLKDYGLESIMDFTFEEEEAIRKGEMTYEEAVERLNQRKQEAAQNVEVAESQQSASMTSGEAETLQGTNVPGSSPSGQDHSSQQSASQIKEKTEQAISQMYALKAKYIGELGKLERSARSDYAALSAQQKKGGVRTLVSKYMSPALSLQSQCDAEVDTVISNLKSYLQANNQSTEIIPVMKAAYEREKELKKAYYLSLVQ